MTKQSSHRRIWRRVLPAAIASVLAIGGLSAAAGQVVPEPQGRPSEPRPNAAQGQTPTPGQEQGGTQQPGGAAQPGGTSQPATTPQPQSTPTAQGAARIGETGNVVRMQGSSTQVVLTLPGLGAAIDKLPGAELAALAGTLAIAETIRLGQPGAHKVTIAPRQFLGRPAAGSLAWLVTVHAPGLSPSLIEKRLTTLSLGPPTARDLYPLEFTLTNLPPSTAQYEVTAPGHDWMVSRSDADKDRTYPLVIANRAEAISALRLSLVSLKRSDDAASMKFDDVKLLQDVSGLPTTIDLLPNETRTVFLRLEPSRQTLPFGSFTGQVQLVSTGTPPKAVPLTVRVTSSGVKLAGALLVFAGLLVTIFTTTRLQPRLARLQALRPATLLRDRVIKFADESTKAAAGDVAGIVREASAQAARLETTALDEDGLLPPEVSIAGGGPASTATQMQTRLTEISGRLAGLTVLRDTVLDLAKRHPANGRPANVQNAIVQLNALAPKATTAAVATTAAEPILDALRTPAAAGREAFEPIPARVTTQQLDFMLHETANVATFIWAAISLAIGVTYIYSRADFGTPMDLLGVFLWGLGLTAFGAGVQQLTPRQVATRIGVAVPKTAGSGAQS